MIQNMGNAVYLHGKQVSTVHMHKRRRAFLDCQSLFTNTLQSQMNHLIMHCQCSNCGDELELSHSIISYTATINGFDVVKYLSEHLRVYI